MTLVSKYLENKEEAAAARVLARVQVLLGPEVLDSLADSVSPMAAMELRALANQAEAHDPMLSSCLSGIDFTSPEASTLMTMIILVGSAAVGAILNPEQKTIFRMKNPVDQEAYDTFLDNLVTSLILTYGPSISENEGVKLTAEAMDTDWFPLKGIDRLEGIMDILSKAGVLSKNRARRFDVQEAEIAPSSSPERISQEFKDTASDWTVFDVAWEVGQVALLLAGMLKGRGSLGKLKRLTKGKRPLSLMP
jgi:hypothetical protein